MKACFGCGRKSPSPAKIQAATHIQRVFRGGATRTALRSGSMARKIRATRTTALRAMKPLSPNLARRIMHKEIPRVPGSYSKRYAPKQPISPGLQRWLRLAHMNSTNFPTSLNYDNYVNRVTNLTSGSRQNKIKAILARYELLKPDPRVPWASGPSSPRVLAWRRRLNTNFRRKYTARRPNGLSSRELYAFLLTVPNAYLHRAARTAPTYV